MAWTALKPARLLPAFLSVALLAALLALLPVALPGVPGAGMAARAQSSPAPRFIFRDGQIIRLEPGQPVPGADPDPGAESMLDIRPERVIRVGYLPIVPAAPLFVIVGDGLDRAIGYRLEMKRYTDALDLGRALAGKELDIAYVDVGSLLYERSRSGGVQVIAAAAFGGVSVVARGNASLVIGAVGEVGPGVRKFVKEEDRAIRVLTGHRASAPYIGFAGWLAVVAGLQPDQYRLRGLPLGRLWHYASQGRPTNPRVDLVALPEPLLSGLLSSDSSAVVVMPAQRLMRNQPASVLAVTSALVEDERAMAQDLVALHIQAIQLLTDEPEAMLPHVRRWADFVEISDDDAAGLLNPEGIRFGADPRAIADATLTMHNALFRTHTIKNKVNINQLINTTYYDQANPGYNPGQ